MFEALQVLEFLSDSVISLRESSFVFDLLLVALLAELLHLFEEARDWD